MTAYGKMDKAIEGLLYGLNRNVESRSAVGEVGFGKAITAPVGSADTGASAKAETAKVLLDADLVTGNTINIVVNGTTIPQITFASSHVLTMGAIATAIVNQGFEAVVNSEVSGSRELLIRTSGSLAVVTFVIASGGSQAGVTITGTTTEVFVGISIFTQKQDGVYNATESISVLEEGDIWVQAVGEVEANAKAFLLLGTGKFGATGDLEIGRFKSNGTDSLVRLSVDGYVESALAEQF